MAVFFVPSEYRTKYINNPFQLCRTFKTATIVTTGTGADRVTKRVFTYSCHLKSIKLYLSGDKYDEAVDECTKSDDLMSFLNLIRTCGFFGKPMANGISYNEYLDSSYVAYYDFSTNKKAYEKTMVPAQRVDDLDLDISFSEALPYQVKMFLMMEYPSTLVINDKLNVTVTHPM